MPSFNPEEWEPVEEAQVFSDDWEPVEEQQAPSSSITHPFKAQAFKAAEAVNRGIGSFSENLDEISKYIEKKTGLGRGGAFEKAAKFYANNAEYWHQKAQAEGTNVVDDLIGEAVGGAVPGIAEFMLNVPYSALLGAAKADKEGKSEAMGALAEGAKRFMMGKILHGANVLKQPSRSAAMGGVFGTQAAVEGGSPEDIAKAVGTGTLYGLPGKGQVGLRDIVRKKGTTIPEVEAEVVERPAETPEQLALPKPQGFTMSEPGEPVGSVTRRPMPESTGQMVGDVEVEYRPILGRKGPYKTEDSAKTAMSKKGLDPETHEVRAYDEGFAIYERGKILSPVEWEPIEEQPALPAPEPMKALPKPETISMDWKVMHLPDQSAEVLAKNRSLILRERTDITPAQLNDIIIKKYGAKLNDPMERQPVQDSLNTEPVIQEGANLTVEPKTPTEVLPEVEKPPVTEEQARANESIDTMAQNLGATEVEKLKPKAVPTETQNAPGQYLTDRIGSEAAIQQTLDAARGRWDSLSTIPPKGSTVRSLVGKTNKVSPGLYTSIDAALKGAKEIEPADIERIQEAKKAERKDDRVGPGFGATADMKDKYGAVTIKSPSGAWIFTVPNTTYHLENLRKFIEKREGKREGVYLGSGLGGLQPHYERAVQKVSDAISKWKETSKIPFVSHTRPATGGRQADTRSIRQVMDDLGVKGERRKLVIENVLGYPAEEGIRLSELSKEENALVRNFLKNASTDVYGKAMLEDIADYRGVTLSPKFIENAPNMEDIPRWSVNNITSWRVPDMVDKSGELYKHTIAPYEDANHALRLERDQVNRDVRELMPGVSKGSKVSAMLQDYAEGKISLDQIPEKWRGPIQKTAEYTRARYDDWLNRVNEQRDRLGKKPIFRRNDYFTHGQEVSDLATFYGGAEKIPNQIAANTQFTHPNSPFFKYEKRIGGEYVADGIGNFMKYRDNALRVIHFTPAIIESKAYIRHIPPNAHEAMMGWVDETMVGKLSSIDRMWDRMIGHGSRQAMTWTRTKMVKNIVLGSARILVQQPSTFAQTFSELATGKARNVRDVAQNITDAFVGFENAFTKSGKHILSESREYRDRLYIDDIDPTLLNKTEKALAYFNGHLDRFMVSNAYLGKYRQLMRNGMPHEDAVIEADKFAKRTQASYQKGNLNAIMRSETGKNVLPLQTFTFNVMNHLAYDVPKMVQERGKAATFAYGLTLLAGIATVNAAYEALGMTKTWDWMSMIPGLGYIKYGASGPLGIIYNLARFSLGDERQQGEAATNLKKVPWQVAPPFGGEQIRKSIDGILTVNNPSRKPYKLDSDWDRLMAVVFGPGSTKQGRKYWKDRDKGILDRFTDGDSGRSRRSRRSARRRRD